MSNPNRPDLSVIGHKDDHAKPMPYKGFIQQFPRAIIEVSRISEFGAKKYAWNNWHKFKDTDRVDEAMTRHILAEAMGDEVDFDSELMAAAHTAWNAMARLELMLREIEEVTFDQTVGDSSD